MSKGYLVPVSLTYMVAGTSYRVCCLTFSEIQNCFRSSKTGSPKFECLSRYKRLLHPFHRTIGVKALTNLDVEPVCLDYSRNLSSSPQKMLLL